MTADRHNVARRMVPAAPWRLAGVVAAAGSQLVVGVLLARALAPAQFGLMALAAVMLGLLQPLGDLGVANAVVQRSRLTDRHLRVAFTFCTFVGFAIAFAAALTAPLAAAVTSQYDVASIVRVLSVTFAFRGLSLVSEALLRRRLDFRSLFVIDACSFTLGYGVVALSLAFRGYGAWSLVWGALMQTALASGAQVAAVRHPLRPLLAWQELGELLRFGIGASLSGWANFLALNGDNWT